MKPIDFIRALDESDLDVYEIRYLLRVFRRGACWETMRTTNKTTGISIGKLSALQKSLIEKGWLEQVRKNDRLAFEVRLPDVVIVHDMNTDVHVVNTDVHDMNADVHVVRALPLIEQNEDHSFKYINGNGTAARLERDPEAQAAIDATLELAQFWTELTKRRQPRRDGDEFKDNWFKPFNTIWITCGRDVNAAKARIQQVRAQMIADGLKIFNPAKLPEHVQALVDAEMLPMTQRMNGNGRVNLKNDPEAREAHNRAVFAKVAAEYESGEWSPWTIQGR